MNLDDELCLCFHVSQRKVINYLRIHQPQRVAQLSECHGAGTGCGWCRPFLKKLFEQSQQAAAELEPAKFPTVDEYAEQRAAYRARNDSS